VFPDDSAVWPEKKMEALDYGPERKFGARFVVWWIEKNKIKGSGGGPWKPRFHGRLNDGRIILEGGYVLSESRGGTEVLFDKDGGSGAATEGFQPVSSGPGEEIEDTGFRDEGAEGGEDSCTDAILGGAEIGQIRYLEASTGVGAPRDTKIASPSSGMTWGCFFRMT
jgi:hypothetical protein